ncbi:MAG: 6-phosphofructokinase [Verrucomicrobiales bacterium]|nr:6-phosphofructokinase [Verrucomicrobiota bacterium JB025]
MNRPEGKVLVAQGGGPTHVINQSVVGVALAARNFPNVTAVYGALHGVSGIINEDFIDLSRETVHNLNQVAATPSSGLLSTRDKPDREYCEKMFEVMRAHDIRYFFYVGGNDSSDTVRIVSEHAKAANYDMRAIHIPKTIDNDLEENDHCPGFGSAAKFVSQAFAGAGLDNRALGGIYIGVVMGRHAGFLTAAAALAKTYADDGPHLIYLPERAFDQASFLADVKRVYEQHGFCMIAVSEGISDADGTPMISKLMGEVEKDAHGNIQLSGTGALGDLLTKTIKDELNIKRVRADTFGYLQRSFLGAASDTDQHEAREVGEKAVQFAMIEGATEGSVAIRRTAINYAVDYELVPISNVAGKTRHMPAEYINADGNGVTQAFIDYCRPLIGSSPLQSYRFRAPAVPKILG